MILATALTVGVFLSPSGREVGEASETHNIPAANSNVKSFFMIDELMEKASAAQHIGQNGRSQILEIERLRYIVRSSFSETTFSDFHIVASGYHQDR